MKFKHLIRNLPLEHETSLFILISGADFFMTYFLLRQEGFREANPIANYVIKHWNVLGMICLKFTTVAIVCVIAQVIAFKNIKHAKLFLQTATVILTLVVFYSFSLLSRSF